MTSSTLLIVLVITLSGVAGAVAGAVAASAGVWMRQLLPFSAGLLIGMSVFLMAPEAFAGGEFRSSAVAFAAGFGALFCVENILHSVKADPHRTWAGVMPVATAISIHSVLDGWNTVVALSASSAGAWAFAAGMALHKLTGGFAVGAVIRAAAPNTGGAVGVAAGVEAATVLGAWLFVLTRNASADAWTNWLLAATAGSLLYLGAHSLRRALHAMGVRDVLAGAGCGLVSMWVISLMAR